MKILFLTTLLVLTIFSNIILYRTTKSSSDGSGAPVLFWATDY